MIHFYFISVESLYNVQNIFIYYIESSYIQNFKYTLEFRLYKWKEIENI